MLHVVVRFTHPAGIAMQPERPASAGANLNKHRLGPARQYLSQDKYWQNPFITRSANGQACRHIRNSFRKNPQAVKRFSKLLNLTFGECDITFITEAGRSERACGLIHPRQRQTDRKVRTQSQRAGETGLAGSLAAERLTQVHSATDEGEARIYYIGVLTVSYRPTPVPMDRRST
jgi:hypothetical protein